MGWVRGHQQDSSRTAQESAPTSSSGLRRASWGRGQPRMLSPLWEALPAVALPRLAQPVPTSLVTKPHLSTSCEPPSQNPSCNFFWHLLPPGDCGSCGITTSSSEEIKVLPMPGSLMEPAVSHVALAGTAGTAGGVWQPWHPTGIPPTAPHPTPSAVGTGAAGEHWQPQQDGTALPAWTGVRAALSRRVPINGVFYLTGEIESLYREAQKC